MKSRDKKGEFREAADSYLAGSLAPDLALSRVRLISDRPRAQVHSACFQGERVAVKLYPAGKARIARRTAVMQRIYEVEEIPISRLRWHDVSRRTESAQGCVCVIFQWVEGANPPAGKPETELALARHLARIHQVPVPEPERIRIPGITEDESGQKWSVAALGRPAGETFLGDPGTFSRLLQSRFRGIRQQDSRRVGDWCAMANETLKATVLTDRLLHGDYHRGNLIVEPDGELVTIDLDTAQAGVFRLELGRALLRIVFGSTSSELASAPLRELVHAPRLVAAENAYLDYSPRESRECWHEHREIILVAAYLRSIRRLAERSVAFDAYPLHRRLRFRAQAFKRWNRVLEYLQAGK